MFQLHLLKNKVGLLLMRIGQQLSSAAVAPVEPLEEALPDDKDLPPAHWLELVGQQAPQWLEESQHPQMVRYRSTQKKEEELRSGFSKTRSEFMRSAWSKAGAKSSEEKINQNSQSGLSQSSSVPFSEKKGSKALADPSVLSSSVDTFHFSDYPSEKFSSPGNSASPNNLAGSEQSSTFKDCSTPSEQTNQAQGSRHKPQSVDKRSTVDYKKPPVSKSRAFVRVKPYKGSSKVTPEAVPKISSSHAPVVYSKLEPRSASETSANADELRPLTASSAVLPEAKSTKPPAWSKQFTAAIKPAIPRPQNQSKNEPIIPPLLDQDKSSSRKVALENTSSNKYQKQGQKKQTEVYIATEKPETSSFHLASAQPLLSHDGVKQTAKVLWPELPQDESNASEPWPKLPSECKNPKVYEGPPTNLSVTPTGREGNSFEQRQALEQRGQLWSE